GDGEGAVRLVGQVVQGSQTISAKAVLPHGEEATARLTKTADFEEKAKEESAEKPELVALSYPNVGHGYRERPKTANLLFKNATVWTGEAILENTDVWIKNGKIAKV